MATDVVMPQMGESITEGTIVRWMKKVGDRIDRDEPLLEITTDKVDAEVPSPAAGIVVQILAKEGETVSVNHVLAVIDAPDAVAAAPAQKTAAVAAVPAGVAPGPYVAGLVAGIPALTSGRSRPEYLAALIASNTELTSLRRHLQQLNGLLRQGSMDASTECRETVDRLGQGVRGHLAAVSAVLADLRPRARGTAPTCRPPA